MSIVLQVSDPHFGSERVAVVEALVQLGFYQFFYPEVYIMKAARIHGPKVVTYDTVPDPIIVCDTDIILKVTATAICGSDLHIYSGDIVPVLGVYPASYDNFPVGQFFG